MNGLERLGFAAGNRACITGGADGIGRAVAMRCAALKMKVALIDVQAERMERAAGALTGAGSPEVLTLVADVSDAAQLADAEAQVVDAWGGTDVLMANAGIQPGSGIFGPRDAWERVIGVNLWGVINAVQAFAPGMIAGGRPGCVIVTGSKQGITTPPGDPCYNVAKAGVKAFAEALAHHLRNEAPQMTAHLLIPGFVFTELTRPGATEKPAGAWTPDQTADFMMASLERGDFYILCPDNDVDRQLDEKRMAWAIGDIIENRPPLSRWHPDWAERFARFVKEE